MEKSRPQLNLAELHQVRWLLGGLIGVLSAWTVFYMEVDALLALALITVAVPVFTWRPTWSKALPAVFHRLAFPFIVVVFALDLWTNREPLPAMIRLDLMLLGYRCVAPRGRREDLQLILLALFVVVVTGVFTVSIAFVVQILAFTAASLALLLTVTLSDARAGGGPGAVAGWERVKWLELFARLRAVADLRVVGLGAALFAGVVGLSAVLFLALPRFEISNDFFLDRLITKKSMTGFSEDVRFDEVVDIQQDTRMAFAVDVSDPAAVPADPYWRMLVLDEYSGSGFRMSSGLKANFAASREKMNTHGGTAGRERTDSTVWTIYFQPGVSRYLPLMGGFGRITFGEPQALTQSSALRLAALQSEPAKMVGYRVEGMDTDGILRDRMFAREGKVLPVDDMRGTMREYRRMEREAQRAAEQATALAGLQPGSPMPAPAAGAETGAAAGPAAAGETGAPDAGAWVRGGMEMGMDEMQPKEPTFLELNLERPEDKGRLEAWAEEIGGKGAGGADFARRAGAWLQARHQYSLSMRLEPGEGDALVRWIDSNEPGHCELFAGSLVLLARAAGVPARLVTGFKGGLWNATSGSITVRNSDAHAWAEIWDAEQASWLRADATPGAQITPTSTADQRLRGANLLEVDGSWGARIDGLKIFWYRRIVNFDQGSQLELLRGTKEHVRATIQRVRQMVEERVRAVVDWVRSPWDFGRVAGNLLALAVIAGAVIAWRRAGSGWWLAWRSRRAASHRADPVRRAASVWLARLERAERGRAGAGLADVATQAKVDEARARLLRLRFGAREGWAAPAVVFRLAKQAARAARRARR